MEKKNIKEKRDESIRSILDAATEVFAEAGFAGARMDEIARRAGVNKAMIYYRIGDKEALYTEVLHDVFGDTAERISRNIGENHSPEEKLRSYIKNLATTMERHPYMPYIMMREMASRGRQLNEMVAKDLIKIIVIIKGILDEGREKGVFIQTDPLIFHFMVIGILILFKASEPMRALFYPILHDRIKDVDQRSLEKMGKRSFEDAVKEIERLVMHAIKA